MSRLSPITIIQWLLLGPVLALLISFGSRFALEYASPDKLSGINEMVFAYPQGLLMSLLTPWGWLMYGGVILMHTGKYKAGIICTVTGAAIFGIFWPIWATFMLAR